MNDVLWQKIRDFAKSLLPLTLTLFAIFLSVMPLRIPDFIYVVPVLGLIPIYHWAIYRPNLLPIYSIFFLGLLQDVLMGNPIGFYILIFLTMYGLSLAQRRFFAGKAFNVYWFGFSVAALIVVIEGWCIASIWNQRWLSFDTNLVQYIILIGIFPMFAWILLRLQQKFLQQG